MLSLRCRYPWPRESSRRLGRHTIRNRLGELAQGLAHGRDHLFIVAGRGDRRLRLETAAGKLLFVAIEDLPVRLEEDGVPFGVEAQQDDIDNSVEPDIVRL